MLLENKNAVIYGGGGTIGSAMAKGFAAEGATCHLVGRTPEKLEAVATAIREAGGRAETAVVDVLDVAAVRDHADSIVEKFGTLDISVNVVSQHTLFQPLVDVAVDEFSRSLATLTASQLATTQAAARHMSKQQSGVILFFGGSDASYKAAGLGNVQIGMDIVEALRRQWAADLAPYGVRVVSLLTGGIPASFPDTPDMAEARQGLIDATLLKREVSLADVGHVAAFVASERARSMTKTQVNISAGAVGD